MPSANLIWVEKFEDQVHPNQCFGYRFVQSFGPIDMHGWLLALSLSNCRVVILNIGFRHSMNWTDSCLLGNMFIIIYLYIQRGRDMYTCAYGLSPSYFTDVPRTYQPHLQQTMWVLHTPLPRRHVAGAGGSLQAPAAGLDL